MLVCRNGLHILVDRTEKRCPFPATLFYIGHKGEVRVYLAPRGYSLATDESGYSSPTPLFMKYTPDVNGQFAGREGHGYRSIEAFVDAANEVRAGNARPEDLSGKLSTIADTVWVTKILDASSISLDEQRVVDIR